MIILKSTKNKVNVHGSTDIERLKKATIKFLKKAEAEKKKKKTESYK